MNENLVRRQGRRMSGRTGRIATSYDWADIEADRPIDKAVRQRIMGERMMVSRFVLEEGFHVEPHTPQRADLDRPGGLAAVCHRAGGQRLHA